MRTEELVQAIGLKLEELFPGSPMYVDKITSVADGCFLLSITDMGGRRGISARKSSTLSFDLMYFCRTDEKLIFMNWADTMQDAFKEIEVNGRIIRTRDRSAHPEDMIFHFIFSVEAVYIEYEQGEPMEDLEVSIEKGKQQELKAGISQGTAFKKRHFGQ